MWLHQESAPRARRAPRASPVTRRATSGAPHDVTRHPPVLPEPARIVQRRGQRHREEDDGIAEYLEKDARGQIAGPPVSRPPGQPRSNFSPRRCPRTDQSAPVPVARL